VRKRFKIPISLLILLIVIPVLLVIVITQTGLLRSFVVSRVNALVPEDLGLKITVQRVRGPYVSGVVFDRLAVVYQDHPQDTLLSAGRISLRYRPLDFWRQNWVLGRVDFADVRLQLPPDSVLKSWAKILAPGDQGPRKSLPDFTIDTLTVTRAFLDVAENERLRVADMRLDGSVRYSSGRIALILPDLECSLPGLDLSPVHLRLAGLTTGRQWSVDSLELTTPLSAISLSGTGAAAGGRLDVFTEPLSLEELSAVVGLSLRGYARYEGLVAYDSSGTITGEGELAGEINERKVQDITIDFHYHDKLIDFRQVRGTALGARLSGKGYLDVSTDPQSYGYTGRFDGFNLKNVVFNSFETDLSGWMELEAAGLRERDINLDFDLSLGRGRFDDYTFDSAAGHLFVNGEKTAFDDDFFIRYKTTDVRMAGHISYHDSMDVFGNAYFRDLRDFEGQTFIDSLAGEGYAFFNFVGLTESPDLIGQFESDSLRVFDLLTESFYGRFNIPHFFDQRGGNADIQWGKSTGWSLPFDSLQSCVRLSGTKVLIDSTCAFMPGVQIRSNGWLDWESDTIPVHLYGLHGQIEDRPFAALDTIRFIVDTIGFDFEPFVLHGELGRVAAEGRIDFDTRMDAHLQVDSFSFAPHWRRIFPDIDLAGVIRLEADLSGDFDFPIIQGRGAADLLTYEGRLIGNLTGTFTYADHQLQVDTFALRHPEWYLTGGGIFPIDLAFAEIDQRVLDSPQDFRVIGNGQALDPIVWAIPDVVESVEGPWEMAVELSGTPNKPQFGGWARLTGGVVKPVELENSIANLDVGLEFRDDTVKIVGAVGSLNGKGKRGNVTADGTIKILALDIYRYDLHLFGTEIPARFAFQDYEVLADIDLTVTGSTPPLVAGTIRVIEAEDREPFSYDEEYELADTTLWDWDMAVVSQGNYWIRNDQVNAEMAFDLRLLREDGIISVLGTAEILPGRSKVYVFDRTGRIQRGTMTFDQPGSDDPELDLEILFRIPRAGPVGADNATNQAEYAQDMDLTLLVGGRASEPLIRSAEGSPYSDQDILLLLAANRPAAPGGSTSESDLYLDRIKFAATGLFFSQLERAMARAIGLETLSVETGATTAETELTVGTYFLRNFYVYGSSTVGFDRGQEIGFEYRFRRGLYLDGLRNKDNLYRLNLHLNWDY